MSDGYQAIYDAVRSKISGGNVGDVVREVAANAFDISWVRDQVRDEFMRAALELQRPCVIFKPTLTQDGNAWLAIYGDLPTGVVGVGDTPAAAMLDFDTAWYRVAKVPSHE